jgi:hypothetical protein
MPNDGADARRKDRPRQRRPGHVPIPGVDEILGQLIQLNGAVLIGAMSAKEAALIQKNLKTVLDVQLRRASRGDAGPSQEALVDLCRRDPRALDAVESFLTDDQFRALMEEIAGGDADVRRGPADPGDRDEARGAHDAHGPHDAADPDADHVAP